MIFGQNEEETGMQDAEFYQLSYQLYIIYQTCPFKVQLSLAGYAQSSVPGELNPF